ncbi:MAG TPA: hypothetical protein VIP11_23245 [Gemmatimonadaceae bacterium]
MRRRSRVTDYYRFFEPKPGNLAAAPPSEAREPIKSFAESHREYCLQWRPREWYVTIVDSKKRDWLVYDATDDGLMRQLLPLGSPRAGVRFFWREDHVRMRRMREQVDWVTAIEVVRRQLRSTTRIDFPEQSFRSKADAIQDLYDSRRGMGRR